MMKRWDDISFCNCQERSQLHLHIKLPLLSLFYTFTLHLFIEHFDGLSSSVALISRLKIRMAFLMYMVYIMQEMTHINECRELWPLEMRTFSTVALIFDRRV